MHQRFHLIPQFSLFVSPLDLASVVTMTMWKVVVEKEAQRIQMYGGSASSICNCSRFILNLPAMLQELAEQVHCGRICSFLVQVQELQALQILIQL